MKVNLSLKVLLALKVLLSLKLLLSSTAETTNNLRISSENNFGATSPPEPERNQELKTTTEPYLHTTVDVSFMSNI